MSATTVMRPITSLPEQRSELAGNYTVHDQIELCWAQYEQELSAATAEAARVLNMIAEGTLELPSHDHVSPEIDVADFALAAADTNTRQTISQRTREAFISFYMRIINKRKSRGLRPCPLRQRGDMPKKLRINRHQHSSALRIVERTSLEDQMREIGEGVVKTESKLLAAI